MQALEEIKKRAAAATPGPWTFDKRKTNEAKVYDSEDRLVCGFWSDSYALVPDAEFIAHARTDIPRLVAALEYAIEAMRECEDMEGNERHDLSLAEIESILAGARDAGKK